MPLAKHQIDQMVKDACNLESRLDVGTVSGVSLTEDVCCHVKALACEVEELTSDEYGVPRHAWSDPGFRKAVGMLWGYFNSPAQWYRQRFGEINWPWPEIEKLMRD